MKKIKIGDHEITIGPTVVTITEDTTITPTTDMTILVNNSMSQSEPPITVTLGDASFDGCTVKFIMSGNVNIKHDRTQGVASIPFKERYDGISVAMYVYRTPQAYDQRWHGTPIGVYLNKNGGTQGAQFTGKYYFVNGEGYYPTHTMYVENTMYTKTRTDSLYDVWAYDFTNRIPTGAVITNICGFISYKPTSSSTTWNTLSIGAGIPKVSDGSVENASIASPGDNKIYLWARKDSIKGEVKFNFSVEFYINRDS